jgi:hypothetical protein
VTFQRLAAIGLVYFGSVLAWIVLGSTIVHRTGESDQRLAREVASLWGGQHNQVAPDAWHRRPRIVREEVQEVTADGRKVTRPVTRTEYDNVPIPLASSRVGVDLRLDQRRKGLLWYDTYAVGFRARYSFQPPADVEGPVFVRFTFPSADAIYDGFVLRVDGQETPSVTDLSKGIVIEASRPRGAAASPAPRETVLEVAYRSRGFGEWTYAFAPSGVAQARDFRLDMTTDFAKIDFPPGTLSPTAKTPEGAGYRLAWAFESLVTGQRVGMDPPNRLNPGPLASRITFFAPVGLLFFLTVMVILGVLRGRSLHPMNYFFLSAAFFAFHLLLAYLVDHFDIHGSFALSSAVSVFLVVTYLRLVAGMRTALLEAGLAQLVFLVLFSYAFFFEGYTGLTVTVGAILTLFVLMQLTGRVSWAAVFAGHDPIPGKPADR